MPGKHVARHRAPRSFSRTLGRLAGDTVGLLPTGAVTRTVTVVGAAGLAVGVGVATSPHHHQSAAASTKPLTSTSAVQLQAHDLLAQHAAHSAVTDEAGSAGEASQRVSRSIVRPPLLSVQRADKASSLPPRRQSLGGAMTKSVAPATPKDIASSLLASYGWDSGQFSCLDALWTRESNWNMYAQNSSSGAYGIPQALPGSKMAEFGSDWATNATTQIEWGLSYIRGSYGSPCGAWGHSESYGWY